MTTKTKSTVANVDMSNIAQILASMNQEQLKAVLGTKAEILPTKKPVNELRITVHESKAGNQCLKVSLVNPEKRRPYDVYLTAEMAGLLLDNVSKLKSELNKILQ
jgi:NAD-dependent SIR2 family protein deacetylase